MLHNHAKEKGWSDNFSGGAIGRPNEEEEDAFRSTFPVKDVNLFVEFDAELKNKAYNTKVVSIKKMLKTCKIVSKFEFLQFYRNSIYNDTCIFHITAHASSQNIFRRQYT